MNVTLFIQGGFSMIKNILKKTTLALALVTLGTPLATTGTTVVNASEISSVTINSGDSELGQFDNEVLSKINELEEKGYTVEENTFTIEGQEFLEFSNDSEVGIVHINTDDLVTIYVQLDENNDPYRMVYESKTEGTLYINVNENGIPVGSTESTMSISGIGCDMVIGLAGSAITGIYGAAIGAITANPLIGIGAGMALNAAWTPVGTYGCP